MKTFIFLILLNLTLFASVASDVEYSYEQLNQEIDKISSKLSPEEKVSLYFLVLSTHDTIVTSNMLDQDRSDALKNVEQESLKYFATLQTNNDKLDKPEIQKLEELYTQMNKSAFELMQNTPSKSEDFSIVFILFAVAGLLLGLLLGYIFFKKSHAIKENNIHEDVFKELQEEHNHLLSELKSLERQKEFWHVEKENTNTELQKEKQILEIEVEALKTKTIELQASHEVLISEFQNTLKSLSA